MSNVIFAVPYKDFDYYADIVNQRRDRVTEAIKEMIASQDVSEWYTLFALLCEYQSVLYHFENNRNMQLLNNEMSYFLILKIEWMYLRHVSNYSSNYHHTFCHLAT